MAVYKEIYSGPPKNYGTTSAKKRYIAIHNTSNNASASNEVSYAKRRTDGVSSHYYVDNKQILQSLDTRHRAWHAGSQVGNTYAISYEITGTNGKSRNWWLKNVAWDLLAKQIAEDMKRWGIQNKKLTVSEMQRGGISGIVTHDDMRRAWGGTTHTDPGSNFPMDYLIKKVNQYLSGGSGGGVGDDMTPEERQWLKDLHWAFFRSDAPNRPAGSISNKLETIRVNLEDLRGKDFIDEAKLARLIVEALSERPVEEIAAALKAALGEDRVSELKNVL